MEKVKNVETKRSSRRGITFGEQTCYTRPVYYIIIIYCTRRRVRISLHNTQCIIIHGCSVYAYLHSRFDVILVHRHCAFSQSRANCGAYDPCVSEPRRLSRRRPREQCAWVRNSYYILYYIYAPMCHLPIFHIYLYAECTAVCV